MARNFRTYTVNQLPDPFSNGFDIDGIYYVKEANNQMSIAIRDELNTNWQINRVVSDSIEWENIMNKPDTVLGYNITDGATIDDVSWGDKQW